MELTDLRVRNYRTIGAEQTLKLSTGTTLVGPNNSGKTNLLRSVLLFFTGYSNSFRYQRSTDLTFGVKKQQTSLTASFAMDPTDDADQLSLLDELHGIVGTTRTADQLSINLYFAGDNNTPVYRVFGNQPIPTEHAATFSRKQRQLVEQVLRSFRVHYVPSAKGTSSLYADLLQPFLTEVAHRAIAPHLDGVRAELREVADSLNAELASVGLHDFQAQFSLDEEDQSRLLSGFDLMLSDPDPTEISQKGQGIQSTALFASFVWITERELADDVRPIWLIEEPESYLHPELTKACQRLLDNLSAKSTVILTTHSLGFVPQRVGRVLGVDIEDKRTVVRSFATHAEATSRIRTSLGVQFSDYYNLARTNIFTEGPSDSRLLKWAVELIDPLKIAYPLIHTSLIQEFGGVAQLEGFLKAVYEFIYRERACVAMLDGDEAGNKSRRALQAYLSPKHIQFQPNREFVSVRSGFAIEGLFPDKWIIEMNEAHPGWFQDYSVDASGSLEPFRIKDNSKNSAQGYLQGRAEEAENVEWATRWIDVANAIESSLSRQADEIEKVAILDKLLEGR